MMVFLQTVMKAAWGQAEILGWEDVMYPVGLDNGLRDMWACAICWTRCGPKKQAMDVLQKEEELATDGRRRTDHKPGGKLMLEASFG